MKLKEFSSEEIFIFFFPLAAARSVTRLGDFWKFLATKILAKEAQMIGNFLGYLEKPYSYVKTALATFCTSFGKNWATFYSNIWSHWAATIVLQKSTEEANAF